MVVIIKSELGEMKNTKKLADPVNVKTATTRRQLGITVQSIIVKGNLTRNFRSTGTK